MGKILLLGSVITAVSVGVTATASDFSYVRKLKKPDFFIPESALQQPEKLPTPKYYKGSDETVKVVRHQAEVKVLSQNREEEGSEEKITEEPLYQHKYDEYTNDLEHISRTGKIPENKALQKDLKKMNSEERVVVKKKPYQTRPVKEQFDKALENSLAAD